MLAGDVLYRDMLEVNPPMAAYTSMIPVWVSDISGLPVGTSSTVVALTLMLGTAAWVMALTRRPRGGAFDMPVVGAAVVVAAGLLPGGDFAQREHLMFMLILPYAFVLWRRAVGLSVSFPNGLAGGLAAGVGLALKPHFIFILVTLEFVCYLESGGGRRRHWPRLLTIERLSLLGLLAVYGLSVILARDYLTFLGRTAGLYADFGSFSRLRLVGSTYTILLLVCLPAAIRAKSEMARLARFLVAIGFAGLIIGIIQGKGWSYHFYPAMAALTGAVIVFAYDFVRRAWKEPARIQAFDGGATLLAVAVTGVMAGSWMEFHQRDAAQKTQALEKQVEVLAHIQPHGSFLVLSAVVGRSFPLANYSGLEFTSPFPAMWWIRSRQEEQRIGAVGGVVTDLTIANPLELMLTQRLVDRFLRSTPGTVLVDTTLESEFGGARFPYIAYLEQDEQFKQEWRNYTRMGAVEPFVVWVRQEAEEIVPPWGGDDAP